MTVRGNIRNIITSQFVGLLERGIGSGIDSGTELATFCPAFNKACTSSLSCTFSRAIVEMVISIPFAFSAKALRWSSTLLSCREKLTDSEYSIEDDVRINRHEAGFNIKPFFGTILLFI